MAWKMAWRMVWRMGWRMVWRMVQSWVQDLAVSRCRELFWPSHDLPSQDNLELHVDGTPSPPEHTRPVPRETAKQLLPSCLFVSCVLWKTRCAQTNACLFIYSTENHETTLHTLRGTNAFDFTVETALRNFTLISFCLDGNKRGIKPFVISNIISTSNSFFCSPLLCHQPFWGTDCFIYFSLAHSRFLKIKTFLLARLWWSNYFKAGVCK